MTTLKTGIGLFEWRRSRPDHFVKLVWLNAITNQCFLILLLFPVLTKQHDKINPFLSHLILCKYLEMYISSDRRHVQRRLHDPRRLLDCWRERWTSVLYSLKSFIPCLMNLEALRFYSQFPRAMWVHGSH